VRSQLRQRFKAGPERAIANVDLFLEMARAYLVRGLRAFACDMRSNWEEAVRQAEGLLKAREAVEDRGDGAVASRADVIAARIIARKSTRVSI
jgi:hypothetical protein